MRSRVCNAHDDRTPLRPPEEISNFSTLMQLEELIVNKKRVPWLVSLWLLAAASPLIAQQSKPAQSTKQPNIVIIWGDDIGQTDVSAYSMGLMGFHTPNIDRVAKEGMLFTDYYAEQSCTAGRASFITGQSGLRTGLTKVGLLSIGCGYAQATQPRTFRWGGSAKCAGIL